MLWGDPQFVVGDDDLVVLSGLTQLVSLSVHTLQCSEAEKQQSWTACHASGAFGELTGPSGLAVVLAAALLARPHLGVAGPRVFLRPQVCPLGWSRGEF